MTAVSLGPLVLAGGRLAALIALASFLLLLEILAWRRRRRGVADGFGRWPALMVVGWIVAARTGFVVSNWPAFAAEPSDMIKLWQGGFSARAGAYAVVLVLAAAALSRQNAVLPLASAALLAAVISGAAMLALTPRSAGATSLTTEVFADLDGQSSPLADPPGKPVIVNLWASWCGPCRREMPMLKAIAATDPSVVMRFVDQGETPAAITRFLRSENLSTAGIRLDPARRLMARYGAIGLPATLFFRADGTLSAGVIGEISRAEVLSQMNLLTGKAKAPERPAAGPGPAPHVRDTPRRNFPGKDPA